MKDQLATQDYIKTIAQLVIKNDVEIIKNKQIALKLGVTIAAVNDMAKKLEKDGLILIHAYKGVELTDRGEKMGLKLIRHHRLWEVFLHQTLDMPWHLIHDEAEFLEHAASNDLMNRIDTYLGYPKFDPHGNPIPSASGELIFNENEIQLTQCKVGVRYALLRFESIDSSYLDYLSQQGFAISTHIQVVEFFDFDRSVVIDIQGKHLQLSYQVAKQIFVSII
ncbi:MAG: metal-dependent transcriptional regulator [Candidatus Margulisiibacteriota bacterium]